MQQQMYSLRALAERDADQPFVKPPPPSLPPPDPEEEDETEARAFAGLLFQKAVAGGLVRG